MIKSWIYIIVLVCYTIPVDFWYFYFIVIHELCQISDILRLKNQIFIRRFYVKVVILKFDKLFERGWVYNNLLVKSLYFLGEINRTLGSKLRQKIG